MKAPHLRSLSTRGTRFQDTLPHAVSTLPVNTVLWEITPDGFIPLAHRHLGSLSLNHTRLTAKERAACIA